MILDLTAVGVRLHSADEDVLSVWHRDFSPWLSPDDGNADAALVLERTNAITPPRAPLIFRDDALALSVYREDADTLRLHFHDGALVAVTLNKRPIVRGEITTAILHNGRLLDVTYTALSPFLRRRGLFLAHAFAAARNDRCVLLVGPSGSGKTTAGLSLLQQGWRLLGNDVVMLQQRADAVYALPTPGRIRLRPQTQRLLPSAGNLAQWAPPATVALLCFPQIVPSAPSQLHALPPAVGLARLMAESVDRWDAATVPEHVACLRRLCAQTAVFTLQSGTDVATWPQLLTENA